MSKDNPTPEEIIQKYRESKLEKRKWSGWWEDSDVINVMKLYASTQPKRVSDEEILAKFPIDRNATYEDEIRENLDNDRRREGAKWMRDLPSSQEWISVDELMEFLNDKIPIRIVHTMPMIKERFGVDTGDLKGTITKMEWGMLYQRKELNKKIS